MAHPVSWNMGMLTGKAESRRTSDYSGWASPLPIHYFTIPLFWQITMY